MDADGLRAELGRDPHRGDVHLALLQHLRFGQLGFFVRAEIEFHALGQQPVIDRAGFSIGDRLHLRIERGLAEPFLEDASRMQQFVGDDRVEHAHAAFVEDAHDELLVLELLRERLAGLRGGGGHLHGLQRLHVRGVMLHLACV